MWLPVLLGLALAVDLQPALDHLLEFGSRDMPAWLSPPRCVRAWVGQYFTASSTAARCSSGGFGVEHGELALLRDREHLGRLGLAGPVALAQVAVDHDPHARPPRRPAPVAHPAGLLELHDHLGVVVAVGVERLGQPRTPSPAAAPRRWP